MDLAERRRLLNRKGSDTDMSEWKKVGQSSDVVNEPSVTLSKPCTEIIVIGEELKAIENGQIQLEINNNKNFNINGLNANLMTSTKTYYLAKLRVCGFGIYAEVRGDNYSLTTNSLNYASAFRFNVVEITSIKLKPNTIGNAFTSGKFEVWGR